MATRHDDAGTPDEPEHPGIAIVEEIVAEVERQHGLAHGGNTAAFDSTMAENDFIAAVLAYLGRASRRVSRNDRDGQEYHANMIKAAALIVSALVAESVKANQEPE